MAYSYGAPPTAYGQRQLSYGSMPPGAAPGFAPGMDAPPGMPMSAQSPSGQMPSQFHPPPNMPNINFNAPVIRLGVDNAKPQSPMDRFGGGRDDDRGGRAERGGNYEAHGRNSRLGLGAEERGGGRNIERDRQAVRDSMLALQPPTREEVMRTIFVGGLADGAPEDEAITDMLRAAGKLRRWTRCTDAQGKKCKFGFAEFEDVESLEAADEIFSGAAGIKIPIIKNGAVVKTEDGEVKNTRLNVVVDPQSKEYIEEWKRKRKEDDEARQFRIDGCKEDLRSFFATFISNHAADANGANGDTPAAKPNGANRASDEPAEKGEAEVVTIPLTLEDELADIPAEQRAQVAEEIKAFRERSNRRDLARLEREEAAERSYGSGGVRSRLASPPPSSAPLGPAAGANGIPIAPRGNPLNAPSGPRGYRGVQIPAEYANGVAFVNGSHGLSSQPFTQSEEEDSATDEQLEDHRQARRDEEIEKSYKDAERRLLNRERTRRQALERERQREEDEKKQQQRAKETMARRLREWDDYEEEKRKRDEYYKDHIAWVHRRSAVRDREVKLDEQDRQAERREMDAVAKDRDEAKNKADDLLNRVGNDMAKTSQPSGGIKLSLGSAAAKSKAQAEERRGAGAGVKKGLQSVENLLEDEEDAAMSGASKRPELKPLDPSTESTSYKDQDLSDDERAQFRAQLASEIPTSQSDLFEYQVKWNFLTPSVIDAEIKPFVTKKVVEYLGVQEDFLVDSTVDAIKAKKSANEVVGVLADVLEDEAEVMVKKVWRLVVFWSECEARGLGA
ncbi:hypothetical protein K431DRAFT_287536 [Polychaeton citri CBS 116435]|uniref:PWI domain-containing protein n=1 Tax=Polychaeton citri CBS 116435 TaxID=1314669 RepID=A0A9P4Q571_9PEZI|nr:hypothetical protein K431DRAFT_287536 [Polychaeton citri CBS 116435]